MKKYSNVIFDLFDTLILFKPELLPKIVVNGTEHFSTGKDVFDCFKEHFPDITFNNFFTFFIDSYKEFQKLKNIDNREYPNRKRFEIMLDLMGIKNGSPEILEQLVHSHMDSLSKSMIFPEKHRSTLSELINRGYKLSILSNFDYSPTAYKLLDAYDLTTYFVYIFISDDIGWRKPSRNAFGYAIRKLNITASDAIFIGDDYERDIIGANNSDIDSIFINFKNEADNHIPAVASVKEFGQILDILK
ncbi:MAG: HAD family hydrolase [Thermodesulfobacteriota bacterium]